MRPGLSTFGLKQKPAARKHAAVLTTRDLVSRGTTPNSRSDCVTPRTDGKYGHGRLAWNGSAVYPDAATAVGEHGAFLVEQTYGPERTEANLQNARF